jgi:hypothetical protein
LGGAEPIVKPTFGSVYCLIGLPNKIADYRQRRKTQMKRLVNRFGKLITASFILMAIGIIVFVLSLPLYMYADIDTDVIGFIIFTLGLALLIIGIIRRNKLGGWKLAGMIILAGLLLWPMVSLIFSLIYYLATGQAPGD